MKIPEPIRKEVLSALAEAYSRLYDEYKCWADAEKELLHEQESEKAQAAHRMASNLSHRLIGFRMAAVALGISAEELLEATREIGEGGAAQ